LTTGYYLATNIKSAVAEVVRVEGDNVKCLSAGTVIILSKVADWRDFEGPITYETFRRK